MKTIRIEDEDYEILTSLLKELQTQENNHQAFPYFWVPASERLMFDHNNEGKVIQIYDPKNAESYTPEEYASGNPLLWDAFLEKYKLPQTQVYKEQLQTQWLNYLKKYHPKIQNIIIYSSNWEQQFDNNPSLFLSDVQNYITQNKHHLGRNPHAYADTIFRMPKMQQLIEILYKLK